MAKANRKVRWYYDAHEDAAIGIGTLIVFIALVLVAAIAAAVVINTAGNLQESAEKLGSETQEDVSTGIKTQHMEGQINAAGDEILDIRIYIVLYAGADAMDLRYLVLHIEGSDNEPTPVGFSVDAIHANHPNPPTTYNTYTVTEISDPLNSYDPTNNKYYLDQEATLRLELNDIDDAVTWPAGTISDGLSPLSDISVKFINSKGGTVTREDTSTPGSYTANAWVEFP
jgi:flagellin FlaB